jgi:hypothetical protein
METTPTTIQGYPNGDEDKLASTQVLTSNHGSPTTNQYVNDAEERKIFMQDLNKFMIDCNKPLNKLPIMGYKELDLYQLFREVVAHGGFNEVVKNVGTWSKIWKRLGNFDPSITDSSFRLKKNYERYLLEYEYKRYPQNKLKGLEPEKPPSHKRTSSSEFETSPIMEKKPKLDIGKTRKSKRKPSKDPLRDSSSDFQPSPSTSRKRKTSSTEASSDEEYDPMSPKSPKLQPIMGYEPYYYRDSYFSTREEMDDLESAVATLCSLRFLSAVC